MYQYNNCSGPVTRPITRSLKYTALRLHTQKSTPSCLHRTIQEHTSLLGSLYMCLITALIIRRISRRRLCSRRVYIKVNLLHPQDTQHFLHILFQFHYWLERWGSNVLAGTLRSTAKTRRRRTGICYRYSEHSLPPLRLNRSYQTDQ